MSPRLDGIDVSSHQGVIDWRSVATTPALKFVMSRMTHGGHGVDDLRVDRQAEANRTGMRANFPGTPRGYYHFLGTSTPAVQAAHFAKVTGPLLPGEFVVLDVEPDVPARVPVLSVTQIVETLECIEREFGVLPGLYIGRFYSGSLDARLWRFPLFLPAYTSEARYRALAGQMGRPVTVWQWGGGGEGATVPGITGRVDSNRIEDSGLFASLLKRDTAQRPTPPPAIEEDDMGQLVRNTATGELAWSEAGIFNGIPAPNAAAWDAAKTALPLDPEGWADWAAKSAALTQQFEHLEPGELVEAGPITVTVPPVDVNVHVTAG